MATVLEEKPDPAAKFGSQVDEQIAQATNRIRVHDLTLGVLTLAAMVAVYATVMILLDRSLTLVEWVRQLALGGFLVVCAAVGYLLIARPLVSRVNPLYAAARVEETIDDAKNSVTGYVEAQENGSVHAAVKAAMSAKAAKAVGDADVNQAVNHRNLLIAGGVLVTFLLALGVLFFILRPTQFNSLVGRTFLPFSASPIATRTQLTLVKPEQPSPTITTGQTITVGVHVGGKVPSKTDPDRVRVLLRHNPADPNYEEIPMVEGDTKRDWSVKIPEYLVQNGFWYKVAAGDAVTPECKVTVRSLPLFTDFEASYEYPKYTRKQNDKANDPNVRGVRGTKVTLVARTNRQVKDGVMKFEAAGLKPVAGKLVDGKPDSLLYQFTISEPTRYRLTMITFDDEQNADAPPFLVLVDSDQPPRVEITKPEEPETTAPANGQLAVDGTVGDDFGIDKIRLRMRVAGRDLAPVFYNGGKSLRREKDNTWPTDLSASGGFKLSADLTKLRYADGARYESKETDVIEFWVEAIDNCTETKPKEGWGEKPQPGNVGSSQPVRKLTLTAPMTADEEKKQLDQQKDARQKDEKQHNDGQQQQLNNENREPPKPDTDKKPQDTEPKQKDGEGQPKSKDGKGEPEQKKGGDEQPKDGKDGMGEKDGKQDPKDGKKGTAGNAGAGGMKEDASPKTPEPPKMGDPTGKGNAGAANDPNMMPPNGKPPEGKNGDMKSPEPAPKGGMPNAGMGGSMNPPPEAPQPRSEDDKNLEEKIKQAQAELDKMRGEGGDAKPNPTPQPEERTDPAQPKPKPQPMPGGGQDSQPKDGPKPPPMMGMDGENPAADSKPQGKLDKPQDPNPESKPGQPGDMETAPKPEPLGGSAGKDKEPPAPKKDANPADPRNTKKDPASGAEGKPATEKKDDPAAGPNDQPKNPAENAGAPKPNPDPDRGMDKNPQPAGAPQGDTKPKTDPEAAGAKPDKAPPSGEPKPMPKDGMGGKQPDASETKEPPKNMMDPQNPTGGAAEAKPDTTKPMGTGGMPDDKAVEKGIDKPQPKDQNQTGGDAGPKDKKAPGKGDNTANAKVDPKQLQDIKDAAKDLNDPDPTKQQAAREKLDKAIGKDQREMLENLQKQQEKELEKLKRDLQSKDEATRQAGEKRLEELRKQAKELGDQKNREDKDGKDKGTEDGKDKGTEDGKEKGRELTEAEKQELRDLARDLASEDDMKRKQAEQTFDDKLGKDARDRLQEEIQKRMRKPEQPQPPPAETDPRNKARAAQLQLEDFEKQRNGTVPENLKWDDKDYEDFLNRLRDRVKKLEQDADKFEEAKRNELGSPTIRTGSGEKVVDRANVVGPGGLKPGATLAPPGFNDAQERFLKEAKKLGQDK